MMDREYIIKKVMEYADLFKMILDEKDAVEELRISFLKRTVRDYLLFSKEIALNEVMVTDREDCDCKECVAWLAVHHEDSDEEVDVIQPTKKVKKE